MSLPPPLDALDLGEVLGHLRTGGQVCFHDADEQQIDVSLWFVVGPTRCWLVGATQHHQWTVADPDVELVKGWTWDAVRVGPWTAPLRRGTRKEAERLLRIWKKAPKGGEPVPPPRPLPAQTTAPAARATHLPDWVLARPAPAEARWLFACPTSGTRGEPSPEGSIVEQPVWIIVSDSHQCLATTTGWSQRFEHLTHVPRTARRDHLLVDGVTVPQFGVTDSEGPFAAVLVGVSTPERWGRLARRWLDDGAVERVRTLLAEAYVLERHAGCWEVAAQLAFASGHPADAVRCLAAAIQPETPLMDGAVRWLKQGLHTTEGPPTGLLTDCTPLVLPQGFPAGFDGALEVWGTAAILAGRTGDGLELWHHKGVTPRSLQAAAAVAEDQAAPDAWEQWCVVAELLRLDAPERAMELLERALTLAPEAARPRWMKAAWRHRDGFPDPFVNAVAVAPPPEHVQPAESWRAAAQQAEDDAHFATALVCWQKAAGIDRDDRSSLERAARLATHSLNDHQAALAAWLALEERAMGVPEPMPPLWRIRVEAARSALALDDLPQSEALLRRAVGGDFLVPEAWTAALNTGSRLDPATLQRWRHIQGVLEGRPVPHQPLVDALDEKTLDGLHPGGIGWLERARQSLDTAEPPPRNDLMRGLERIDTSNWPALYERLTQLAAALGTPVPDAYLFRGDGAWGVSAWPTRPPLILVGHDHLAEGNALKLTDEALTFALAVELAHLAADHPLLAFDGGLVGTSRSVYGAFGRYAGTAETVVDVITLIPGVDQVAKLQTLIKLSRSVFSAHSVVQKASGVADTGQKLLGMKAAADTAVGRTFQGAALQFRLQADRAAFLLTGDLRAALEAMLCADPLSVVHRQPFRKHGLLGVLPLLSPDTRLRAASLVEFAATWSA